MTGEKPGDEVTKTFVIIDMGPGEWGLHGDRWLPGPLLVHTPGQLHHRVQGDSTTWV